MTPIGTINYITSCGTFVPSYVLIVISAAFLTFIIVFSLIAYRMYDDSGFVLGFIFPVAALCISIPILKVVITGDISVSGSPFKSISPSSSYSANAQVKEDMVTYDLKDISYESIRDTIQSSEVVVNVITSDGEVIELQSKLIKLTPNSPTDKCYVEIVNEEYTMPDSEMEKFKTGFRALTEYVKYFAISSTQKEAYIQIKGKSPQSYLDSLTTCKSITLHLPISDKNVTNIGVEAPVIEAQDDITSIGGEE